MTTTKPAAREWWIVFRNKQMNDADVCAEKPKAWPEDLLVNVVEKSALDKANADIALYKANFLEARKVCLEHTQELTRRGEEIDRLKIKCSEMDELIRSEDGYIESQKSLQAEIEYLNRQLADERSGDCDLQKTIRRLTRENERLENYNADLLKSAEIADEAYNQLKAEVEELKTFVRTTNKYTIPGVCDTPASAYEVFQDMKAEVERRSKLISEGESIACEALAMERDDYRSMASKLAEALEEARSFFELECGFVVDALAEYAKLKSRGE